MDLFVKFDENLYLNPSTGEIKKQVRSSIPLTAPISVRRMKPSLKYTKKIGDIWVGSNKMSFLLILAYTLLKNQKNKVVGFFSHGDRYLYIEASVDLDKRTSIVTGFTSPKESPEVFITVSGKVYDAVFGETEIRNAIFDFLKAYRELSRRISPSQVAAVLLCLTVSGYLFSVVVEKPPKIERPGVLQKTPPPPPPLTTAESNKLSLMLKDGFIENYGAAQESIRKRGSEKWLKSVSVSTAPGADGHSVSLTANFTYSSFYPFEGSRKEGKTYVWTAPQGLSLGRQDLDRYVNKVSPRVCLKYLINYDVTERTKTFWSISVKEEKSSRIAFLLNLIYSCPCVIKDMTIDEKGMSGSVLLDATET